MLLIVGARRFFVAAQLKGLVQKLIILQLRLSYLSLLVDARRERARLCRDGCVVVRRFCAICGVIGLLYSLSLIISGMHNFVYLLCAPCESCFMYMHFRRLLSVL